MLYVDVTGILFQMSHIQLRHQKRRFFSINYKIIFFSHVTICNFHEMYQKLFLFIILFDV